MSSDDQQDQQSGAGGSAASNVSNASNASNPARPHHNPNARLRELLSIPERLRTDAQWDEIIEIEISIGPRKPPVFAKTQNQSPQFRQNDNRGERQEKKAGTGGNKHMRKRHKPAGNKQGDPGNQGNPGAQSQQGG